MLSNIFPESPVIWAPSHKQTRQSRHLLFFFSTFFKFLQKRSSSTEITWRDGKFEDWTGVRKLQVCCDKVLKPGDSIISIWSEVKLPSKICWLLHWSELKFSFYFTSLLSGEKSVRKIFCGNTCPKSWVAGGTLFWATCKPLLQDRQFKEPGGSTHTSPGLGAL